MVLWSCVVIFSKFEMFDFDENILPRYSLTYILNVKSTDTSVDHEINLLWCSLYCDNDQLVKMITNNSDQFSIPNLNIQNINSIFDQVRIIFDGLESKNCEFSAIVLQETWLSEASDISSLSLNNYNFISQGKNMPLTWRASIIFI